MIYQILIICGVTKRVRVSSCNNCGSELIGTENFCPYCGGGILTDDSQDVIVINSALPVLADYEEVIKVNLENPHSIRIPKAKLNFYPYYLIHYVLNVNRKDPAGKNHHIHQQGTHILNAFNGRLLTGKGNTELKSFINIFIPKR
jgi:RNA polymerase subunit RPABC4/transcription elongation factor Spt4